MKTIVLGASTKPNRYGFKAVKALKEAGHEVVPIGRSTGAIENIEILNGLPEVADVHTITIYLNPDNQSAIYDYVLGLQPTRIIFNPGAENVEFKKMAQEKNIEVMEACTLVLLAVGNY